MGITDASVTTLLDVHYCTYDMSTVKTKLTFL